MPFGLFKKKEEPKDITSQELGTGTQLLERKEMEDLSKLGELKEPQLETSSETLYKPPAESVEAPTPAPEPSPSLEVKEEEKLEEKPEILEVKEEFELPKEETEKLEIPEAPRVSIEEEKKEEITFEELPLKELCDKINEELKSIKKRFKAIGKTDGLTLESPEMIDLLDLYVDAKNKLEEFINEVNKLELAKLPAKKTIAAVYKFRACKSLADIKKQVQKIEAVCRKAGFIPTKIHEILESRAEDLVNSFLREKKGRGKKK